jgi:putative DNA methylase
VSEPPVRERRKLIETSLPLEAIARQVRRDTAVSPLHLWWSHKPGPACRAVVLASLLDDPGEGLPESEAAARRAELADLVARVAAGDGGALQAARQLLARTYPQGLPTVCDPFCGSGAIPCEAQRLGLPVWASDLNPVAVLSTAALLDFPARFAAQAAVHPEAAGPALSLLDPGEGLASDVRFYGHLVRDRAEARIGRLYPPAPTGEPVIAWIWCRTARCPNPACGAEMPLVHSFRLSERPGRQVWVSPQPAGRYVIGTDRAPEPPAGTYGMSGGYCLRCKSPVSKAEIRAQAQERGLGLRLLAMVVKSRRGRRYLPPDPRQEEAALAVRPTWAPDTDIAERAVGVAVAQYGLRRHRDLFTPRQLLALATFSDLVREVRHEVAEDARRRGLADDGIPLRDGGRGATAYADAIATYLALALDRAAAKWCTLARWQRSRENIEHPFASPGLQMTWDFAEANPFSPATGNWLDAVDTVAEALARAPRVGSSAVCRQMDAASPDGLPDQGLVVCTDPPYFDNLPYADTSDLFYVWLRRTLGEVFPDLFRTLLTPKSEELVADPHRHGSRAAARALFLERMREALAQVRRRARPDVPLTLFYALRQSGEEAADGWAAMLESLLAAGFRITGTWPLRTEHAGRRRSLGSNALASSIVLVCRPRAANAPEASLREVLRELRRQLPVTVAELTAAGVAPVDLAQAAIGPGMAIFSGYARVLAADGSPVPVATALRLINQEVDLVLTGEETQLDPASRFCVAWFEQFGFDARAYGEADVLARAKNTAMEALVRVGAVEARGGTVRLLPRTQLPSSEAPPPCAWLALQQLVRTLEDRGETAAGAWLREMQAEVGEAMRPLAYRLYASAERLGLAEEARAYGGLVASWREIELHARRSARALRLPGV